MALWDIPQHSYYDSPKYRDLKNESAKCAVDVSELLPAVLHRVGNELKSKHAYREKMEEVNLLVDVARDHYHSMTAQSAGSQSPRGSSVVKKEVIDVDEGFSSWLRVLECGENRLSLNLCPPASNLTSISEDIVIDEVRVQKKETLNNAGISPAQDKLRQHYKLVPSPTELSRTTSAPAHLGKSLPMKLPSQRRNGTEFREPPPPTIVEGMASPRLSNQHDEVMDSKSKEETQYESDLERALFLSGLEFQPASKDVNETHERFPNLKQVGDDSISIATLAQLYQNDFEDLRRNQFISVTYLDTYQGRVKDSVNGCTVIAPLLAIHHLCNEENIRDRNSILAHGKDKDSQRQVEPYEISRRMGIRNDTVKAVIDVQAARVAPLVRNRLGLPKDALIIPADVHDYLIEEKFILADQFAGVYGGNILDDVHLRQFIDFIHKFGRNSGIDIDTAEPVESRKVAATFFFHEHVVSLHRVTRNFVTSYRNQSYQTPTAATKKRFFNRLRRKKSIPITKTDEDVTTFAEEETWYEIIDSLPGAAMLNNEEDREQTGDECYSHLPSTARIRCSSPKSLHACLRWYACSKFTLEDQKFIDSYIWNDLNMEFDPRVFQAYVWSD